MFGQKNDKLKLTRSVDYRYRYFETHNGLFGRFYFCPYCGRVMWDKKKIQVDHIHAVHKVRRKRRLRKKFMGYKHGVNDLANLTASCGLCNKRKGSKGGFWVFRGKYGIYFMPVIRALLIAGITAFFWFVVLPGLPTVLDYLFMLYVRLSGQFEWPPIPYPG